ncbi:MAG: ABC transporter substrate-binding protein [Candidatus Paceibacterota bacterium]
MTTKTAGAIICAALLLGGGAYLVADNVPLSETGHVRIANLPVVQGLPLYVAVEKGYFKEAGITVEIIKYEAPNQIIDAVMAGQVDFTSPSGALGITGIADAKNPGKLKVYAISGGTQGNSGASFVVPSGSTLSQLSDLRGKRLGILAGTIQWRTITREILAQYDLDMDRDLTIVELAPAVQVGALAAGQVDALLALEPVPTISVGKNIARLWIADPTVQHIADPAWLGAGVVNTAFAKQNPETTEKTIQILSRAADEINRNPDAYRQYLRGYTSLTDDLVAKVPIVSFKVCTQITPSDVAAIQKFFDIFTKHNVVAERIGVQDILYCTQ